MKLNIKTSTPLLIFRCLDAATMLGEHSVDHHLNFINENCIDPKVAESIIEAYKDLFLKMHKDRRSFKYLYDDSILGFESSKVSDDFKNLFKNFSELKLKDGDTIYDYFNSKLPIIEKYLLILEETGKLKTYEDIINKVCTIFPFSNNGIEVDAYIVWSPHFHNIQGSAFPDEKWLFAETNEMRINNPDKEPIYIILHEYLHLALNILNNVEEYNPNVVNWDSKKEGFRETEKSIFDEAVTYCIADLIIAKKDALQALKKYSGQNDTYKVRVIESAIQFKSMILDYINGKINSDKLIDYLFKEFCK